MVSASLHLLSTEPEDLIDALYFYAEQSGDSEAYRFIVSPEVAQSVTYRQLLRDCEAIASRLAAQADPGDRAVLMYSPGLDFIKAFYGALLAGVIAVPAYPPKKHRGGDRVHNIVRDCEPRFILCHKETLKAVQESNDLVGTGVEIISTDQIERPSSLDFIPRRQNPIAFIQYTSGSTSLPKGVLVTHGNIAANVSAIRSAFCFDQKSVVFSWLPMFHDMGLIGSVLTPLVSGIKSIFISPSDFLWNPIRWLSSVAAYGVTVTGGPNFALDHCVNRIKPEELARLDLSSLKIVYCGAEPIRAETMERFASKFASCGLSSQALFPCYGMAETTLLVSGGPISSGVQTLSVSQVDLEQGKITMDSNGSKIVGCGVVSDRFQIRIVNPQTKEECESDEIGEIWLRGDSVSPGYYQKPSETSAVFGASLGNTNGEWLRTGDLGFMRDAQLFITGRLKDLIIIRGRNIYPQDIEQILAETLQIDSPNSVAAFSVDESINPSIAALVEPSREAFQSISKSVYQPTEMDTPIARIAFQVRAARQQISQELDVLLSKVGFVSPGSFPRTSSGKIMRSRAKAMFLAGEFESIKTNLDSLPSMKTEYELSPSQTRE